MSGQDDDKSTDHDEDLLSKLDAKSRSGLLGEFLRRAVENTIDSVQTTQTVSREALQYFLSTTDKTRKDVVRLVAGEVKDFLREVDVASEVTKVLTSIEADIKLSVRFKRSEDGVKPEVVRQEQDSDHEDSK